MAAPGVVVTTATRSGPTGTPRAQSGQYFVIGLAERGPVDVPVKVNSLADYRSIFGDRVSYGSLYDDLALYFESGGTQAWVLRVVGAAATTGSLNLMDGQTVPAATLKVDAAAAGAYSSRITVSVEEGANGPDSRKVSVFYDGVLVESYNNLTTVADIVAKFATSRWVRMTDQGSTGVGAEALPAVAAATTLSAGTDDRAAVNAARLEAQLPLFAIGLGDGAVAAPGYGSAMHAALIAHGAANRRIAVLSAPKGSSRDDYASLALGLGATADSDDAGLFGPWLVVSDGAGGTRLISPEGYVAAARSRRHEVQGPWAPAAGELSVSPSVIALETEWSDADHEILDAARVSPIRTIANRIRLYGWRSLSSDETDYASLTVRDTLNRLVTECESRIEPYVFNTIDGRGQLFAEIRGILIGILEPIRAAGGIYEAVDPVTLDIADPGYSVEVSRANNPESSLSANVVHAQVAVRLAPNASLIQLTIIKVGIAAAV